MSILGDAVVRCQPVISSFGRTRFPNGVLFTLARYIRDQSTQLVAFLKITQILAGFSIWNRYWDPLLLLLTRKRQEC